MEKVLTGSEAANSIFTHIQTDDELSLLDLFEKYGDIYYEIESKIKEELKKVVSQLNNNKAKEMLKQIEVKDVAVDNSNNGFSFSLEGKIPFYFYCRFGIDKANDMIISYPNKDSISDNISEILLPLINSSNLLDSFKKLSTCTYNNLTCYANEQLPISVSISFNLITINITDAQCSDTFSLIINFDNYSIEIPDGYGQLFNAFKNRMSFMLENIFVKKYALFETILNAQQSNLIDTFIEESEKNHIEREITKEYYFIAANRFVEILDYNDVKKCENGDFLFSFETGTITFPSSSIIVVDKYEDVDECDSSIYQPLLHINDIE